MVFSSRWMWLFLSFCVCHGGSQLTVEEPRSQAVPTGGNVTLSCSAPGSSFTQWLVGNPPGTNLLRGDGRVSISGSQLNITAFHASEDANLYSCLVGVPGGNGIHTCPANISHARITRQFLRSPSSMVAPAGTTVILHCRPPFSNPAPLIEWRRNGVPLQARSGLEVLPTGNLYLINATRNDTGAYECVAVNPISGARRRSAEAQLDIADPTSVPTPLNMTLMPTDTEVMVGDTVILECAATGHPTPSISWVRVHSSPSSASFPSSTRLLPSGALSVGPVTAVDGGRYRCMAENDDGVVDAEAVITVKVPPQVTLPSTTTSSMVGDSLNLTCWISGTDQATVIWFKGASVLTTEVITPLSASSTFSLSSVTLSDKGLYQCMALNHLGCSRAEISVTISEPSGPTTTPTSGPQITVEIIPNELTLLPGMTANATCSASGWPLPNISWIMSGAGEVPSFSQSTVGWEVRGTLSVSRGGMYTCIATSNGQSKYAVLSVTEIGNTSPPPTSIQPPTQAMTGSGSILLPSLEVAASPERVQVPEGQAVNLSCTVTGGRGVNVSWLLHGREAPGTMTTQLVQLYVVSTLRLDAVTTAHNGEFECVARESGGERSSATITLTVIPRNPRPPTRPPDNLIANWLSNGHIQVQWDALDPSTLPSQLQGYKLNWDYPGSVSQSARDAVSSHQLQYVVTTGLDPRSSYTILVWAYSMGGDGPPAHVQLPPFITSTVEEPTPTERPITTERPTTTEAPTTTEEPTHIEAQIISCQSNSPTELQLLWQAGSRDLSLTYELLYGCNMAGTEQRMRLDPTTTMLTLTHLLPRCEYWLHVEVFSSGPAPVVSNECYVVMPAGQIDINAQVEWQRNGSVVVRWTRPASLNNRSSLEINVGGRGWEPISSGAHLLAELDPSRVHEIELRLSSAQWQGSVNLTVPSASPPTATTTDVGDSTTDLGLLYGVIFGTLLIACAVLVVVILALKYVQMTRRDTDKVINHREKQQETFRRLSLQRSSVSSIKKSPLPDHKTNGNIHL